MDRDLRGYGASDKLPADAITGRASVTQLYADDVAALLTRLRLQDPMVVGFASAGRVVLRLAAQYPGLIGRAQRLPQVPAESGLALRFR